MKKYFLLVAAIAFMFSACEPVTPQVDGSQTDKEQVEDNGNENTGNEGNENTGNEGNENTGNEGNENTGNEGNENTGNEGNENTGNEGNEEVELEDIALNELSGADKFIELYNPNDVEVSLEGLMLVKYDSSKDGGKSTTWVGAKDMKIAPKGYVVLESSDLSDPAEDGDPEYAYESSNHIFKGGLSGKKNVYIELLDASEKVIDTFQRGDEGSGWNQVSGFKNDKKHTFSRVPDGIGEWAYADPTKGAANGEKVADIEQEPEM